MLNELYRYALSHQLAVEPGFKPKKPKAYLLLAGNGRFLGLSPVDKDAPPVMAPDIGAMANGTRYCNPLLEKACIPLCIVKDPEKDRNIPVKHAFFLSMLDDGSESEPLFAVAAGALRTPETVQAMCEALEAHKLKASDPIGFQVDGRPLEKGAGCLNWWSDFRRQFSPETAGTLPRCLITGEIAPALATVPKVPGLMRVGGHKSGDAFLCFDKDSFQSYGLRQSNNAPVSEEAMTAVNAALTQLIGVAPVLGGAKLVHWYSASVAPQEDLLPALLGEGLVEEGVEESESQGQEQDAMRKSSRLLQSLSHGVRPELLDAQYFILPLSGAKGRMMVRGWYQGNYETLRQKILLWFDDLRLAVPSAEGFTHPPKLKALCVRLLKPGGDPKKVWERMDKELPNLLGRVLYSIVNGTALPDETAFRALAWLRSSMLSSKEEEKNADVSKETLVFQLLKAWLRRKQRMKGETELMEEQNVVQQRDAAYHCGQLMALYAVIQEKAMPEVGVGVAERYYAAASSTPAFVIGKLSQLSQHHLTKLEKGAAIYYEGLLDRTYTLIGQRSIPTMLTMEQQAEFALGYYQQRAELFTKNKKAQEA